MPNLGIFFSPHGGRDLCCWPRVGGRRLRLKHAHCCSAQLFHQVILFPKMLRNQETDSKRHVQQVTIVYHQTARADSASGSRGTGSRSWRTRHLGHVEQSQIFLVSFFWDGEKMLKCRCLSTLLLLNLCSSVCLFRSEEPMFCEGFAFRIEKNNDTIQSSQSAK